MPMLLMFMFASSLWLKQLLPFPALHGAYYLRQS